WWVHADDPFEKFIALHFRGLAHYCFGQTIEAILQLESALNQHGPSIVDSRCSDEELAVRRCYSFTAQSSLAYYYGEIAGSDAAAKLNAEQRAGELLRRAKEMAQTLGIDSATDDDKQKVLHKFYLQDTVGAVEIAFARDGVAAREGLRKCQE